MKSRGVHNVRLVEPDWLYHRPPCAHRVRLASVKHGIFHPRLPTLRHMERDDMTCKLADEHCRHTTCLTRHDFVGANFRTNPFHPAREPIHCCTEFTEVGKVLAKRYHKPEDIQRAHQIWTRSLDGDKVRGQQPAVPGPACTEGLSLTLDGVAQKVVTPALKDWRYKVPGTPGLDFRRTQKLIPNDSCSTFRHAPKIYL